MQSSCDVRHVKLLSRSLNRRQRSLRRSASPPRHRAGGRSGRPQQVAQARLVLRSGEAIVRLSAVVGLATACSITDSATVDSCTWPALTSMASVVPATSVTTWNFDPNPPRERPNAWSACRPGAAQDFFVSTGRGAATGWCPGRRALVPRPRDRRPASTDVASTAE